MTCVGSGLCCKKGPCAFGQWNEEKHQCEFLELSYAKDGIEIYKCGKYDEINSNPLAVINPAFGAGCCMSLFNTARNKILQAVKDGKITKAMIDEVRK